VSVQVINIEVENQLLDLGLCLDAEWTVVNVGVISSISVEKTVVLLIGVKNSSRDDLEVEKSLW
jgi:hypothetical protein